MTLTPRLSAVAVVLFALATLAAAPLAAAPAEGPPVAVGIKGGTLGLGVEVELGLTRHLAVRVAGASYDQGLDFAAGDIDYRGDLELGNLAALLDLHPTGSGFRLTAGVLWNDNRQLTAPRLPVYTDTVRMSLPRGPTRSPWGCWTKWAGLLPMW
jgi:hypothetical protein